MDHEARLRSVPPPSCTGECRPFGNDTRNLTSGPPTNEVQRLRCCARQTHIPGGVTNLKLPLLVSHNVSMVQLPENGGSARLASLCRKGPTFEESRNVARFSNKKGSLPKSSLLLQLLEFTLIG